MTQQEIRIALLGLGNIGRHFLHAVLTSRNRLKQWYQLQIKLVAVADSHGAAINKDGFDIAVLLQHKAAGNSAATAPGGRQVDVTEMVPTSDADFLLDAAPSNFKTGEPGLDLERQTLRLGKSVISANKGPIALAYHELNALAEAYGGHLAFSGTVGGGLPVINLLCRELIGARLTRFQGILNSTTNYILTRLTESNNPFIDALKEAEEKGIAETDSMQDVSGKDAAAKLVIIANAALGLHVTLNDVETTGIIGIGLDQIIAARQSDMVIKLVASAIWQQDDYALSVYPRWLSKNDFLASVNGWEMGIEVETDLFETLYAKINERTPTPSASAMLRDVINTVRECTV